MFVWNPARLVVIVSLIEPQVIHAKVECLICGNKFHLALCYGRNQLQECRGLWDSLIAHAPTDVPLLACGDLNNIFDHDEHIGGRHPPEKVIRKFVDTTAYLNLQDLCTIMHGWRLLVG